jgi:hypothetical protein
MATDTHEAFRAIELGPVIADEGNHSLRSTAEPIQETLINASEAGQRPQVGEESQAVEGSEVVSEKKGLGEGPIPRGSSPIDQANPSPPLSPHRTRSPTRTVHQGEKRSSEQDNPNAMLNLPPPLPFDLKVSNLWVGVPHSGPSR